MNLSTHLGRLRLIGLIEAVSFLVLLLVAMPLKYLAGMPQMVTIIGGAHGVLWILFLIALLLAWIEQKWPFSTVFLGGLASVLPFGPIYFDAKYLRENR